jgi:hypothetical protein
MRTSLIRGCRWEGPLLSLLLGLLAACSLAACSRSPTKVVKVMGEEAEKRRMVQFRELFSGSAQTALKRQFSEDGLTEAEGWRDLMTGYMGGDRKRPEVVGEEIKGESATVKVSKVVKPPKGSKAEPITIIQELALAKEEGQWKVALGPMVYTVDKGKKEEKEEKEKPLAEEEEEVQIGDKKAEPEKVEDVNLDNY